MTLLTNRPKYAIIVYVILYKHMTDTQDKKEQKEMIRLSVSEAAKLFGVNPLTIRRAISSQEITYAVVAGRYKLNFESLVKWSQRHTTIKNKMMNRGIGQYVEKWKIKNPLYSPNPKNVKKEETEKK